MQEIGGKLTTMLLKCVNGWLFGLETGVHPAFMGKFAAFCRITRPAGCDNIIPSRPSAPTSRDDVVKGQLGCSKNIIAILTPPVITQENIKSGKGRLARGGHIFFECQNTGQAKFLCRGMHDPVIFGYNNN